MFLLGPGVSCSLIGPWPVILAVIGHWGGVPADTTWHLTSYQALWHRTSSDITKCSQVTIIMRRYEIECEDLSAFWPVRFSFRNILDPLTGEDIFHLNLSHQTLGAWEANLSIINPIMWWLKPWAPSILSTYWGIEDRGYWERMLRSHQCKENNIPKEPPNRMWTYNEWTSSKHHVFKWLLKRQNFLFS